MKSYTARCERSGDWWAVRVPELPGAFTQARRLDQVEAMARNAIALFLDVPADSFIMQLDPRLPVELEATLTQARQARERMSVAQDEAAVATQRAAAELLKLGLTLRDTGTLVGVSHQRIAQLVNGASKRG